MIRGLIQVICYIIASCSVLFLLSSGNKITKNEKIYETEIILANFASDYMKININGHYHWVLYVEHASDCPCGEKD